MMMISNVLGVNDDCISCLGLMIDGNLFLGINDDDLFLWD